MVLKKNKQIFYLLLLMLVAVFTYEPTLKAQTWSDNEWDEVAKDIDYGETKEDIAKKEREFPTFNTPEMNVLTPIKYLVISLLIVLVIIGVVYFIKNNSKQMKSLQKLDINTVSIEHIEENLKQIDLISLINQAKNQQQYKLAVRLCYLQFLKHLDEQKHLTLKINKTNNDYINEVADVDVKKILSLKTKEFEKIWFSKIVEISEEDFLNIYNNYKTSLKYI